MSGWEPPAGSDPENQPSAPDAPKPPEEAGWNDSSLTSGDPLAGAAAPSPPSPPAPPAPPPAPPVGLGDTSSMATGPLPPASPPAPAAPAWGQTPPPPPAAPGQWAGGPTLPWDPAALAGWGSRFAAFLIDVVFVVVLIAVPLVIWGVLWALTNSTAVAVLVGIVATAAAIAISLAYAPYTMRGDGQTPGKKLVGIRVVRDDGAEVTLGWAALRELAVKGLLFGTIGGSFLLPWLANYLWPLVDDENRALHDMLVKSHVVKA